MNDRFKNAVVTQFEAALAMLDECIQKCPHEHWDGLIARYPFWQVAYHVLCFVDYYLAPSEAAFKPRADFHPHGMSELNDEYPSRRFSQKELLDYTLICRDKLRATLAAETRESLETISGFPRQPFSRAGLHLYSLRHVQHHTGQLGAFLRRHGIDTAWVKTGWQ